MTLVLATILLLQDPVPGIIAKIDGKDPEGCFRAIAELADLGPARRSDIEKAAEKLPDFYRQALFAELRETTPVKRVTLLGTGRTGPSFLEELGRSAGEVYWDPDRSHREEGPTGVFDLSLTDFPVLEALKRICLRGDFYPDSMAWGYDPALYAWGFTGRRALAVRHYTDLVHSIPLGGRVSRRARIEVSLIAEPGVHILSATDARLFEARAKGGRVLKVHPGEVDFGSESGSSTFVEDWSSMASVEIEVFEDTEAIEVLKVAFMPRVATGVCTVDLIVDPAGKKETVAKDGFTVSLLDEPSLAKTGGDLRIRINSSRHTREELLKLRMKAEFVGDSKTHISLDEIKPAEERSVDCTVSLNMEVPQKAFTCRLKLAMTIETKPIFAEFRDIPLK